MSPFGEPCSRHCASALFRSSAENPAVAPPIVDLFPIDLRPSRLTDQCGLSTPERRICAGAAPSCAAQPARHGWVTRRRAGASHGDVPKQRIRAGGASSRRLNAMPWPAMADRASLQRRPFVEARYDNRKSAHRPGGRLKPPDGSANCFGCLLIGNRVSATASGSLPVSIRAQARVRAQKTIELAEVPMIR